MDSIEPAGIAMAMPSNPVPIVSGPTMTIRSDQRFDRPATATAATVHAIEAPATV